MHDLDSLILSIEQFLTSSLIELQEKRTSFQQLLDKIRVEGERLTEAIAHAKGVVRQLASCQNNGN